jgi:hypothetical protein
VLRKPDGTSRGFGFVTYDDEVSVEKCLVMEHTLGGKVVEVKRAVNKEGSTGGGMGMMASGPGGGARPGSMGMGMGMGGIRSMGGMGEYVPAWFWQSWGGEEVVSPAACSIMVIIIIPAFSH